jgi:hypothetical protein
MLAKYLILLPFLPIVTTRAFVLTPDSTGRFSSYNTATAAKQTTPASSHLKMSNSDRDGGDGVKHVVIAGGGIIGTSTVSTRRNYEFI